MDKQKNFEILEEQYGCGYWNSCWEHACPCRISVESDGVYKESVDKALKQEALEEARNMEWEE